MRMHGAPDAEVIVVGGGISGLCCAWGLQQRGIDVLLLEAGHRAGGCISTTRKEGYLLEGGPNSALDTSPLLSQLFDALGIAGQRVDANPAAQKRYVVRNGKPWPLPMSPGAFLRTPLFSAGAKARLFLEPFIGRWQGASDETVASFVQRRLGREFLDYAINPFVGGVYAGRPEKLSLRSAFPRLQALEQEFGSLIRGQILGARRRARNAQKSKHVASMFSFRGGMETLVSAITARLHRVELQAGVAGIEGFDDGYALEVQGQGGTRTVRGRCLVLAVPAHAAAPLVEKLVPAAANALAAIPYPPVTVVYSGWRRDAIGHPLDGFGMLVPECEGKNILGSIFSSTLFEGRAAPERVLLTSFVGGARQPELAGLDDAQLRALVCGDLALLLQARGGPEFCEIRRWPRAIPQYAVGHSAAMAAVEAAENALPGLYFCANYRGGISISDCIQSAERTVLALATRLQQGRSPG